MCILCRHVCICGFLLRLKCACTHARRPLFLSPFSKRARVIQHAFPCILVLTHQTERNPPLFALTMACQNLSRARPARRASSSSSSSRWRPTPFLGLAADIIIVARGWCLVTFGSAFVLLAAEQSWLDRLCCVVLWRSACVEGMAGEQRRGA